MITEGVILTVKNHSQVGHAQELIQACVIRLVGTDIELGQKFVTMDQMMALGAILDAQVLTQAGLVLDEELFC